MIDSPSIFITGTDGSGKTTLTQWLKSYFDENGTNVDVVWSRYNNYLSKPLLAATRLTGHNYYETRNGAVFGYHDFQNLKGFKNLYTLLQCIDVNIATCKNILRKKKNGRIMICERGPWDTLADVMLDIGDDQLCEKKTGQRFVKYVKEQFKVVYIQRSYDNIIKTRPELEFDRSLKRKIQIYELLSEKFDWNIIDNNTTLDQTKQSLIKTIHSWSS